MMDVSALKNQIKAGKFQSVYIFIGTEWYVQKAYIQQIVKKANRVLSYQSTAAEVNRSIQGKSLLKTAKCFVVMEDEAYIKDEKLQQSIRHNIGENILILVYNKADKRKKIFKDAIEFEPLKPEVLKKYIKKEINLSDKNIQTLMQVCEYDYGRCLLEIDKIKHFQIGYGKDKEMLKPYDGCFLQLLGDGVIHIPEQDSTFDFIDAVMKRQVERAFELKPVDNIMGTLQLLHNNAKAVLAIQVCRGKDVAKTSGIDSGQLYYARQKTGHYRSSELQSFMKKIQEIQEWIVTGRIEDSTALDYFLVEVL